MRLSKTFIPTQKEIPSDATIPSHQLMLRAGLMRQLTAGVYVFLPLGYKVMKKVMEIIREEMNAIGGQEFHFPALNPEALWKQTGRRDIPNFILSIKERDLILAPTHEEVVGWLASNHIQSYKDLPQIWYQIQTKFRNEPRPRSGVLRGRQFIMKDSYSLDTSWDGLDGSYNLHAEAYRKIFTRCGLKFFEVTASSGAMGGTGSQEFMIESPYGEDTCVVCDKCHYSANLDVATSNVPTAQRDGKSESLKEIHTPNVRTIDELTKFLNIDPKYCAKSLVYMQNSEPILIFMMGNDQLNESKLQVILGSNVHSAEPEELLALTGADAGSIGPIDLKTKMKIIADKRLKDANRLVSGANKNDYHVANIDFQRDVKIDGYYDFRTVEDGEPCPNCNTALRVVHAMELGHIFRLGTKYADSLHATFLDGNGKEQPIIMGSYGIGVERIVACHIEQHHDEKGIVWDKAISPCQVHLIAVNTNNETVMKVSEDLYQELTKADIETLFDDRLDVTPGFKFNDADLLGIPLQVIVGQKNIQENKIEIKVRKKDQRKLVDSDSVVVAVKEFLATR